MKTLVLAAALAISTLTPAHAAQIPSDLRGLWCGRDGEFISAALYSGTCETASIAFTSHGFTIHGGDDPLMCKLITSKTIGREQIVSGSSSDRQNYANIYRIKFHCDNQLQTEIWDIHFDRGGILRTEVAGK